MILMAKASVGRQHVRQQGLKIKFQEACHVPEWSSIRATMTEENVILKDPKGWLRKLQNCAAKTSGQWSLSGWEC